MMCVCVCSGVCASAYSCVCMCRKCDYFKTIPITYCMSKLFTEYEDIHSRKHSRRHSLSVLEHS